MTLNPISFKQNPGIMRPQCYGQQQPGQGSFPVYAQQTNYLPTPPAQPFQNKKTDYVVTPNPFNDFVPRYKPGVIANTRAGFTTAVEVVKGSLSGLMYGLAAAVPAAIVGYAMGGKASSIAKAGSAAAGSIAKAVGFTAFGSGALLGALPGNNFSEKAKGSVVGAAYGAVVGVGTAIAAAVLKNHGGGPVARGVLITGAAIGTAIGTWVGKLVANGKKANIYMQHGAVNNLRK